MAQHTPSYSMPLAGSVGLVDQEALLMMLSYVESECRRLGASGPAHHAAMAAALLERPEKAVPPATLQARM